MNDKEAYLQNKLEPIREKIKTMTTIDVMEEAFDTARGSGWEGMWEFAESETHDLYVAELRKRITEAGI